jgi:hypothetical protein
MYSEFKIQTPCRVPAMFIVSGKSLSCGMRITTWDSTTVIEGSLRRPDPPSSVTKNAF